MADWLDVDAPELLGLAARLTELADRLAAVDQPDPDALPAHPDGRPVGATAGLWLDELPRTAHDLSEVAATVRAVATAVARTDEQLAARFAQLGREPDR
ncbi:hypothetical protein Q2K19_04505 [Micromonospora soli]|uniref:hypothetical protein n=1 Tax=Micromonospora sp. NBRC 110009 TaxID=3061627 RepID=UPI002672A3AD|nr:hypothetical protein [Micromonospora sp. NBRC 110009]WKT99764.1 hypothetical protein Q2K19_04505 [Micromonospora sp. NBRC 110009]